MTLVPQHRKFEVVLAALALAPRDKSISLNVLLPFGSTNGGSARYDRGAKRPALDAGLPAAPAVAGQGA